MIQRVNISLPDELHAKLEPWRDRINVSEVCAAALSHRVSLLEASSNTDLDMEPTVNRLIMDRDRWANSEYARGYKEGREYMLNESKWQDVLIVEDLQNHSIDSDKMEQLDSFSKIACDWNGDWVAFPFVGKFPVFKHIAFEDFSELGLDQGPDYATGVMEAIINTAHELRELI